MHLSVSSCYATPSSNHRPLMDTTHLATRLFRYRLPSENGENSCSMVAHHATRWVLQPCACIFWSKHLGLSFSDPALFIVPTTHTHTHIHTHGIGLLCLFGPPDDLYCIMTNVHVVFSWHGIRNNCLAYCDINHLGIIYGIIVGLN